MLLIKTYLKSSNIPGAGIGLFAGEQIPSGTKIFEEDPFTVKKYTPAEYNQLTAIQQKFIKNYGYSVKGLYYLSIDNDRFINHSEIPNVRETADATYAIRDIEENEELLTDYRTLNMLDWHSSIK